MEAARSLFSPQQDPRINNNHNNESQAWQAPQNHVPDSVGPVRSAPAMRQSRSLQDGIVRKAPERGGTNSGQTERRGKEHGH